MSAPNSVLYLGPDPASISRFVPEESAVLGSVTAEPETALAHVRAGTVDCLVVDERLDDFDVASYLDTVADGAPGTPVIRQYAVDGDRPSAPLRDEQVVSTDEPAERTRALVATVLQSTPDHSDGLSSDRLLAEMIDAIPTGLAVVLDGRVVEANQRASALLGLEADGTRVQEQLTGHLYDDNGEPYDLTECSFRQVLSAGDSIVGIAAERGDGPNRWLLVNGIPSPGPSPAVVMTFKDITLLKEQQQELERRQTELDDAVRELKRSNAELEQFAYVASHDLREPLRMVSNYLGLLERRYSDQLDDDARDFIEYAVEGAQRMRTFINELLDYSRVGREDGEMTEVDLSAVVASVRSNLALRLDESDAEIVVGSLPTVYGHEYRLEQLFQNLVGNAVEYAGDEPPHIEIETLATGEYCEVTVADQGVGFDPDARQQAFDLFYTTGEQSTGIGLAVCKKIVQSHGGEIRLDSTPGEGTRVHVTLPSPEAAVADGDDTPGRNEVRRQQP